MYFTQKQGRENKELLKGELLTDLTDGGTRAPKLKSIHSTKKKNTIYQQLVRSSKAQE